MNPSIRLAALTLLVAATPACSSWSAQSYPTPPASSDEPVVPAHARLVGADAAAPSGHLHPRGAVRALVMPVAFGTERPVWSDSLIAHRLIGSPDSDHGISGHLRHASRGQFRLHASVMPLMVDARTDPSEVTEATLTNRSIRALAREVARGWSETVDLGVYNNDGPDGLPMSRDDDGYLDLLLVTFETEESFFARRVPINLSLPAGPGARERVRVRTVLAIGLPRRSVHGAYGERATRIILEEMGVDGREIVDAAGGDLPTLTRLRLGWLGGQWAGHSSAYPLREGSALIVPLVDVPDHRALWLVERSGAVVHLTRVGERAPNQWETVRSMTIPASTSDVVLPLTSAGGEAGPHLRVAFRADDAPATAHVALTATAARADAEARR